MKVIKRDGRIAVFDKDKIKKAVLAAFEETDEVATSEARRKASEIANHIENLNVDIISVEDIQNTVEEKLMSSKRKDVAKNFIIYRNERTKIREKKTLLMKQIEEKLLATDIKNQNANIDEKSFGGRVGEVSDVVLRKYALDNCMSEMAKNNHINNEIYIHHLPSIYSLFYI